MNNEVVKYQVISDNLDTNENLVVHYNGVKVANKVEAIRRHYQINALKKYGISLKDKEGKAMKNELVINGTTCKPSLPALLTNDDGMCIENIEQYYERTKKTAALSYGKMFKGLERLSFVPEMK